MARKREEDKKDSEEVSEIFEVKKDGEEKVVEAHGVIKEERPTKEQIKKESKLFRKIIFIMIGFSLMFVLVYGVIYFNNHFEVEGVKFEKVEIGNLELYKTSLPVISNGEYATYNFYLRKDPRNTIKILFNGKVVLKENMVINMTDDFNCDGDGVIAVANLLNLYKILGIETIKDDNATCDDIYGRYLWINIRPEEETSITGFGLKGTCYQMGIKSCEILEGTERLMLQTLIEVNKKIKEANGS